MLADPVCDSSPAVKFGSLAAGGVVCYHNMPETFAGILTVFFFCDV